jgi:hypothetical protein
VLARHCLNGDADPRHHEPCYPPSLAGPRYPDGIPIKDEAALENICRRVDTTEPGLTNVVDHWLASRRWLGRSGPGGSDASLSW